MNKILFSSLLIVVILISGCKNNIDNTLKVEETRSIENIKSELEKCYDNKCPVDVSGTGLTFDYHYYPYFFDSCYYEDRSECLKNITTYLNISFCNNLTNKYLCYEDLAVITNNIGICSDMFKPNKNDKLFEEYKRLNPSDDENGSFENYTKQFEYHYLLSSASCKKYYDEAIDVIYKNISHCINFKYDEERDCYLKLIHDFKDPEECNKYRDILESEDFGLETFGLGFGKSTEVDVNRCYPVYAATHNDLSICRSFNNSDYRDFCFYRYSFLKYNSSYCNEIKNENVSEACMRFDKSEPCFRNDHYGVMVSGCMGYG